MSEDDSGARDDRPGGASRDPAPTDEQAAWEAIVAGYGERVLDDPEAALPDASETPRGSSSDPVADLFDRPAYDARVAWRRDDGLGGLGELGEEPARPREHEESEDRYVPPEPPPLPRPRGARGMAWVGVGVVPLIFLVLTVTGVRLVSGLGLLLFLWFVAGFGYLIGTMQDRPGDGWDDGARI